MRPPPRPRGSRPGSSPALRTYASLVGIVAAAAGLAAYFSLRATHWAVMTDELQTSKLATSFAETLSVVPRIHGQAYGGPSQLYPLLIAPFFGLFSGPAAVVAAHALNGLLLASAAWPAYLLAVAVTRSRAAGLVAAALTAFAPWLVLASTLLTENAAYPAFVWALYLAQRTLAAPSARRDLAAVAGLAVAFLVRPQLLALAIALPAALLVHELGGAAQAAAPGRRLAALRAAAVAAARSHRLLVSLYAAAGFAAAGLAAAGRPGSLVGNYAGTFEGDLLPHGILRSAATHLAYVAVGVGIAPALLAVSWTLAALVGPARREARAFAALLLVLTPLLTFEVASFDLRFTPGGFVQDRYLCYLAPLFAVGAVAALLEREQRRARAAITLAVGGLFVPLASLAPFSGTAPIFWAAPAAAFQAGLGTAAGWFGLSSDWLVRFLGLLLAAALAATAWRAPGPRALLAAGAVLTAFSAFEAGYVFDRFAVPVTTEGSSIPGARRDWIDAALPAGGDVALVPNPYLGPVYWWDAEFWNKTVDRVLTVGGGTTYTPFPTDPLAIDMRTGRVRGREPTDLFVLADNETRFRLHDTATVAAEPPLLLVAADRPYRADWATTGAYADGWTRPDRPTELRLFPALARGRVLTIVTLSAPAQANEGLRVSVSARDEIRSGLLVPGRPLRLELAVCIPAHGYGQATLRVRGSVEIPDRRAVGAHLDDIETTPSGGRC